MMTPVFSSDGPRRVYGKKGKCQKPAAASTDKNSAGGSLLSPNAAVRPRLVYQDPFRCINCYSKVCSKSGKKMSDVLGKNRVKYQDQTSSSAEDHDTGHRTYVTFDVTIFEAVDVIFEMKAKLMCSEARLNEINSMLCLKCTLILANLYKCYIEFVEVSQAPSIMANVMAQSQPLIKFHCNRVSDVLVTNRSESGTEVLSAPSSPLDFECHEDMSFIDNSEDHFEAEAERREEGSGSVSTSFGNAHKRVRVLSTCEDEAMHANGRALPKPPNLYPRPGVGPLRRIKCTDCGLFFQQVEMLKAHYIKRHSKEVEKIVSLDDDIQTKDSANLSKKTQEPKDVSLSGGDVLPNFVDCDVYENKKTLRSPHETTDARLRPIRNLNGNPSDRRIKCAECGYFFKNLDIMKYHYIKCHPERKEELASLEENFKYRLRNEPRMEWFRYKCLECVMTFKFKSALRAHMRTLHSEIQGECIAGRKLRRRRSAKIRVKKKIESILKTCPVCSLSTKSETRLQRHLEQKHRPTTKCFSCDLCEKAFTDLSLLRQHQEIHKELSYKCDSCNYTGSSKQLLRSHQIVHRDRIHVCDRCGKGFKRPKDLRDHSVYHDDSPAAFKYVCPAPGCTKKFRVSSMLTKHRKCHGSERILCEHCGTSYTTVFSLRQHLRGVHIRIKCTLCEMGFQYRPGLRNHIRTAHAEIDDDEIEAIACKKPVIINSSGYVAKERVPENKKEKTKKKKKKEKSKKNKEPAKKNESIPRVCPVCSQKLSSEYRLQMHLEQKHRPTTRSFPCDRCDKSFTQLTVLKNHQEIHSEVLFKCDRCDYTGLTSFLLKAHQIIHEVRSHFCDRCGKGFRRRPDLRDHLLVHDDSPAAFRYACPVPGCDKKYRLATMLSRHQKSHVSERNFVCEHCGAAYLTPMSLRQHVRGVHYRHKRKTHYTRTRSRNCQTYSGKANA